MFQYIFWNVQCFVNSLIVILEVFRDDYDHRFCLIKVCLLWHYWAVKGENEAGGSSQITKDCEGHTKRHVGEGVCT